MSDLDAVRLTGLLAEPTRLRVVAALALGAIDVESLGDTTGLEPREVSEALSRLVTAGLVERGSDGSLVLLEAAFSRAARAAAPPPRPSEHPDASPDRRTVLDQAFRGGRLVSLPTRRARRLLVLDELAQRFEPGERYTERQVNASLAQVHEDTAALRRYLVDEGMLDRADGEYWRSGGTVA